MITSFGRWSLELYKVTQTNRSGSNVTKGCHRNNDHRRSIFKTTLSITKYSQQNNWKHLNYLKTSLNQIYLSRFKFLSNYNTFEKTGVQFVRINRIKGNTLSRCKSICVRQIYKIDLRLRKTYKLF